VKHVDHVSLISLKGKVFSCWHTQMLFFSRLHSPTDQFTYEGWNFNSGNYLFTTDTK